MTETAFAAAMKSAGIDTNAALLRSVAEAELRRSKLNVIAALSQFTAEVRDAGGIMASLVAYDVTRDYAHRYLEGVAADMRGENLSSAKAVGEIRKGPGTSHESDGLPEKREGEGSDAGLSVLVGSGPSPSPQDRNGAVFNVADERHPGSGRVVSMQKPARGLAALQTHARVNSIFDTYQTRGGPIGDLVWSAIPRLTSESAREAALLKLIYEHGSPAQPNARVRDVVNLEQLQRMIQKAAEIAGE